MKRIRAAWRPEDFDVRWNLRRRRRREQSRLANVLNCFSSVHRRRVWVGILSIGFAISSSASHGASAISLAGIDFQQLCRDTAHVPLVQAAVHPAYINVWSVQESRQVGRYEQYSFKTQRIDVRVEHDISLDHGLIHRTLDLIGESHWKHRDFGAEEDLEHWRIYHTLETHWPGLQRRQGGEPTPAMLVVATIYWMQYSTRYNEIVAKASALAEKSWCAMNAPTLETQVVHAPKSAPAKPLPARAPSPVRQAVAAPIVEQSPAPQPVPAEAAAALAPARLSTPPADSAWALPTDLPTVPSLPPVPLDHGKSLEQPTTRDTIRRAARASAELPMVAGEEGPAAQWQPSSLSSLKERAADAPFTGVH